jgi:hypothetical protein
VLNDLSDYVKETQDFEEEEDGALESAAICGRGWVGIDFQPDPNRFGDIKMTEIDIPVHEVHFDPAARRPNLNDAAYLVWDRWMTQEDFKIRFPKVRTIQYLRTVSQCQILRVPIMSARWITI